MSKKFNCVMLIDDNPDDNFFHERVIRKEEAADDVLVMESAIEALTHLKDIENVPRPEIIFLDINMPNMNGWEFLEEYNRLDAELKSRVVVVMLTTSTNPDDRDAARHSGKISAYWSKPLTREILEEVVEKYA